MEEEEKQTQKEHTGEKGDKYEPATSGNPGKPANRINKNTISWILIGLLILLMGMMAYFIFSGSYQCKANPYFYGSDQFAKLYDNRPFDCQIDSFGEGRFKIDCNLYDEEGSFMNRVRYVNFNFVENRDVPIYQTKNSNFTIPLYYP